MPEVQFERYGGSAIALGMFLLNGQPDTELMSVELWKWRNGAALSGWALRRNAA